jgi:hypothetical protein
MTADLISKLASAEVQRYIRQHEHDDVNDLLLKNTVVADVPARFIADQIGSRRKAKDKLPLFYETDGVVYPPSANLEQSSSQATAIYKSGIARSLTDESKETTVVIADLTGGMGVDSYFFARHFHTVHYVEPQRFLLEIARHNHRILGARNIEYHQSTAEAFVRETGSLDLMYIDPSRRGAGNRKVTAFEDCQPDAVELQETIFEKTPITLVKASPLLDVQAGIKQLGRVRKVYVVAVNNECKELVFACERTFSGYADIEAVDLSHATEGFRFSFEDEKAQRISYSDPMQFLYEPNAAILKAGAFKLVGHRFQLRKHFPNGKANVTTRNYPVTTAELKRKIGLKDGGEKFLFGFSGVSKKFLAVATRIEN